MRLPRCSYIRANLLGLGRERMRLLGLGTIAEPPIKRWTSWISIPPQVRSQNTTSGYSRVNPDNGWAEESSEDVVVASNQARCEPSNASNVSTEATTGVPNKKYRGPQQGLPGSPTRTSVRSPAAYPTKAREQAENTPHSTP